VKHLGVLGGAVLILVASWWLFGRGLGRPPGPAKIVLPANVNDRPALIRAAHQLWEAEPGHFDAVQCLAFLKLLNDSLDDAQWRAVEAPVSFAWRNHRGITWIRGTLVTLNEKLLPRMVRAGSMADLEMLIQCSNERTFDSAPIDKALSEIAKAPLPKAGYSGSRFSELVAAAIRAGDLKRAKAWLAGLSWEEGTPDNAKAPAARVVAIVDLCLAGLSGRFDLAAVIREWQGQGDDAIGRTALRPVLEQVAARAIRGQNGDAPLLRIEDLFAQGSEEAGAEEYWDRAILHSYPDLVDAVDVTVTRVAVLLRLYGARFKKPEYEYDTWMKVGDQIVKSSPGDPLRAVKYFDRGAQSATSDARRVAAAKKSSAGYLKALEFEKAKGAAQVVSDAVTEEAARKEMDLLLADIRKKLLADQARVAKQKQAIDLDLRRGRLQAMKDKLSAAKKYGRPQEEIRAIEAEIKVIEKQLTE
jgi:hypothetical protein